MSAHEIEARALRLPRHERALLAQQLIASLDEEDEVEKAWTDAARRRDDELRSGQTTAIPADQVFSEARATSR